MVKAKEFALRANDSADDVLKEAPILLDSSDPLVRCIVFRAIGIAQRANGNLIEAIANFELSISEAAEFPDQASESRASLATALAMSGQLRKALDTSRDAEKHLPSSLLAGLLNARGITLLHLNDNDEALICFQRAIEEAGKNDDRQTWVGAFVNRGMLFASSGKHDAAELDLRSALMIIGDDRTNKLYEVVLHNLAVVLSRSGRVSEALSTYRRHDAAITGPPLLGAEKLLDRSELYLQARLFDQALATAEQAITILRQTGAEIALPEALLLIARIQSAIGNHPDALRAAMESRSLFATQDRLKSVELLDRLLQCLQLDFGSNSKTNFASTASTPSLPNAQTDDNGYPESSDELVEVAMSLVRQPSEISDETRSRLIALVMQGRSSSNRVTRIQGNWAAAMSALANGEMEDGKNLTRECIQLLLTHAAGITARELRALAIDEIAPIEQLIRAVAIETADVDFFVGAIEQLRSTAQPYRHPQSAAPTSSETSQASLAPLRLRAVIAELEAATNASRLAQLMRERANLEWEIRTTSWEGGGNHVRARRRSKGRRPSQDNVRDPIFLSYASSAGELSVAIRGDGPDRLVHMKSLADVSALTKRFRFALSRWTRDHSVPNLRALSSILANLSERVLPPLENTTRALVIVPTNVLANIPWSLLPQNIERQTTLAFSVGDWQRRSASSRGRRIALICGPHLEFAEQEVNAIAALYDDPIVLVGSDATNRNLVRVLSEVDILHVAAHGAPRADNNFFSAVALHDGPFNSYDLQTVSKTPSTVILSCCDMGLASTRHSVAHLGMAGSFRQNGTTEIVQSVVPIEDATSLEFMPLFHTALRTGVPATEALHRAIAASDSPAQQITGRSYVVVGSRAEFNEP